MNSKVLVTGGAGFIGCHLVRRLLQEQCDVVVLDKLTYCGSLTNLASVQNHPQFHFVQGDICDQSLLLKLFSDHSFAAVFHLAAESHVDRSIAGPSPFLETNINGTFQLLQASLHHFEKLNAEKKSQFRFIHVSTDEVFGELDHTGFFSESSPYRPKSPYSASKAASDHLARAWQATYQLPVIVTNCSNNYGPYQYPEKLIPLSIYHAINGKPIGIYGKGENIRDWIYVEDHCEGLLRAWKSGLPGETYLFGGNAEYSNNQLINTLCGILDKLKPLSGGISYSNQIVYIEDRKGHDFRYAIDDSITINKLGHYRRSHFDAGLKNTILWYLDNQQWVNDRIATSKREGQRS